eukprot:Gregarina_sp_Poly_1__10338@NODE_734_length_6557_cov_123_557627_g549_i0_p1_GENE_NODE_734_length_6557_cov_123_557627_g549_i0NODE_734_length_6557_cov_123_557627_g549_i0_p1_ORF_typecomplete_len1175_score228_12DEAD/PF00270_29/5_4e54DEAD/PF00270_29/9_1e02DEAD/PF00270_29/1_5e03Helicase_C/PF00271_31/9_2e28ResIII/PF04851_15/5_3e12ResIII/PF04851_15/8_3e03ERCC3_RAD25_C/PF16203_5/1e09Flavi_DEAD/PF07652_14/0_013AAA_19/PF13245_6/2_5e03AAA_19/PF13245_6/0_24AAA_19/PF13245_6/1_3e03SecA_DEAD/PF07517_14/1_8e04SecA
MSSASPQEDSGSLSKRRKWQAGVKMDQDEDSRRKMSKVDSAPEDGSKKKKEDIKAKFRKLKEMKQAQRESQKLSTVPTNGEKASVLWQPPTVPELMDGFRTPQPPKQPPVFRLQISAGLPAADGVVQDGSTQSKRQLKTGTKNKVSTLSAFAESAAAEEGSTYVPSGLTSGSDEGLGNGETAKIPLASYEVKGADVGSETPAAVSKDSLDTFMVDVEKQMESDVLHTLKRLAKHKRKEESNERERQARIEKERGRQKISLDEIMTLRAENGDTAVAQLALPPADEFESETEAQGFLFALQGHIHARASGETVEGQLALPAAPESENEQPQEGNLQEDSKSTNGTNEKREQSATAAGGEAEQQIVLLGVDDNENQQGAIDDFLQSTQETEEGYFDLLAKHGSKKDLQPVDHSQIDYPEFKKNLYVQVREITAMKDHEVEAFRRSNGNIRIRGKGCPRPIREFSQCGLSDQLLKVLQKRGCFTPFPIQMQAIPALMAGRNVIGVAETGSGKTLAYLLPMIRHVLAQPCLREGEGPIGLVIGPTRELVQQIAMEVRKFCQHVNVRCALVYGGGGIGTQLSELKRGAEIVVGTPGRLTEVLTINRGRICNLKRVTFLVLDEADRMFDLGFGPQVERIINNVRPDRQMAMFSATFPSHIENLAKKALYKPLEIIVGCKGRTAAAVTQKVEILPDVESKFRRLLKLLGEWYEHGESIIIFASQQAEVDDLHLQLMKMGYPSLVLHGGHDQEEREMALEDFKSKQQTILIATSIASRGLDVKSVVLVINYTCPDHLEDYIHRIGRTGRAGNVGVAYTLIMPSEADRADDIKKVLESSGQEVPADLIELVEEYDKRVQLGLVQNKRLKGFRGRGYKFSAAEQSAQQEAKQFWKQELGISAGDERDDDESGKDEFLLDNPLAPGSSGSYLGASGAGGQGSNVAPPPVPPPAPKPDPSPIEILTASQQQLKNQVLQEIDERARALVNQWTAAILDPAERERQILSLLPSIRQILANQHPSSFLAQAHNAMNSPDVTHLVQQALQPLRGGSAIAASMVARGQASAAKQILQNNALPEYIDPVTNNYVCTLSINDYPPQARHKVSHRETLNRIAETTGAALQVRGVYIDSERRRQNPLQFIGTKELHVEIIAPTAVGAQRAKRELRSLLESVAKKQLNIPSLMARK